MRVLLIGHTGLLGQQVKQLLTAKKIDFDAPSSAFLNLAQSNTLQSFFNIKSHSWDWCLNCAAFTNVDLAEIERDHCFKVNVTGPQSLARHCKHLGVRLIHLSTDYVFDGTSSVPYAEEEKTHPINFYGVSKLEGEQAVLNASPQRNIVIRTSCIYGIGRSCFPSNIIETWVKKQRLKVVSDQFSSPTYAPELAKILIRMMDTAPQGGIYHAASPSIISRYEWAKLTLQLYQKWSTLQLPINIDPISSADRGSLAKRPLYNPLSCNQLKKIGIDPMPSLEESLTSFCKTFAENR